MFYAPVLFQTLGFKSDASLYSAVITGAVNVISTIISIYSVDKLGRRVLLLEAGVQMSIAQVSPIFELLLSFPFNCSVYPSELFISMSES